MDRSEELSDLERGLVIGCHISKKSVRDIAALLKFAQVGGWWRKNIEVEA
jgi:hypothetical protein